jgi:tetratricopeptide (TPR) repeat protein
MERLLADAVREALSHEDPQRFLDWMRAHIADYLSEAVAAPAPPGVESLQSEMDPAFFPVFAALLGRAIWDGLPLPSHSFRPKPLPSPGRNEPCPCGSGRKYKDCCSRLPAMPLRPEALWPFVLEQLPEDTRKRLIVEGKVPVEPVAALASEYLEQGKPRQGMALLEPLLTGKICQPDEAHDYALNILCSLYDELGQGKKKMALLDRIVNTLEPSPLRSGAWQRLAAIRMDAGDSEGAWEAFRQAQQDDPNSPAVGALEVQLLMAGNRLQEAQARAQFWVKRLRRQGLAEGEIPLSFLRSVAKDPTTAMADLGMEMAGGAGERLRRWLEQVADRSVPRYRVTEEAVLAQDEAGDLRTSLGASLRRMGVREDQIGPALDRLEQRLKSLEEPLPEEEGEEEQQRQPAKPSLFLVPPKRILKLEENWHKVFPLSKPLSVQDLPFGGDDAWDPATEERWSGWLEAHPEAFDSLDILDDLATAVLQHPEIATPGMAEALLRPLLLRAEAIIHQALDGIEAPHLAWPYTENRSTLRSLARRVSLELDLGNTAVAIALAQWLLRLNPEDNHGFRGLVMNEYLRAGADTAALELAARYPGDLQPELPYGQALALYRLNRREEAEAALCAALKHLPKVCRYLVSERIRKPKVDPYGVRISGEDQAWLYREEMRDVWAATPGALDGLKKAERHCKGAR